MDFDNSLEIITPTKSTSLTINGTGALFIPSGTVAERPVSPQSGYVRFNTTDTVLEYYNGVAVQWQTFGSSSLNSLLNVSGSGMLVQTSPGVYAARTITGTTNRVTITNGDGVAGNPTLDIAATYVGQSSITTLGTIGTGVWQGTAVGATFGGTGQTSYAVGDILYANTTTTLAKLADVATGNALISGGINTAPSWGKIGLATHVSGTLGIANGGTGLTTTPTNGQLLIGNGTGYTLSTLTAGTNISITNGAGSITISATGGSGTVTSVAATGSTGLTVGGSPIITAGTLTFTLDTGLQNLSTFNTTGLLVATGIDTWASRTITGTTDTITVTNGSGVAGNPTITIADNPILPGTAGMVLPDGTTGDRPLTPAPGTVRYNTTLGKTEVFQDGVWYQLGTVTPGGVGIIAVYTGLIPATSGTSTIPFDNTTPTVAEGTAIWSRTISATQTTSTMKFTVPFTVDCGTSNRVVIASMFRGTTNIGSAVWYATGGGRPTTITLSISDIPGTLSPVTYSMRAGVGAGSATWYINSTSSGNDLGGALVSSYEITEVG